MCEQEKKEAQKKVRSGKEREACHNYTQSPLQCTIYDNITLKDHQTSVCEYIQNNRNTKGLVLFHSVGSGKTLTSITIIRCLLRDKPNTNVFVLTPTSLVDNFHKEVKKTGIKFNDNVKVYSHGIFIRKIEKNGAEFCRNSVFIIDEAHHFKTLIKGRSGKNVKTLMRATRLASKVFLLTATPVQNDPVEFANLYAMINKKENDINELYKRFKEPTPASLSHMLDKKISYFKNNDNSDYPSVTYRDITFRMTEAYYELYMGVENNEANLFKHIFSSKNLAVFYNGVRRAVNNIDNKITTPKVEWAVKHICKSVNANKKVLVYSNWLKSGLQVNGSMTPNKRKEAVNRYNKDKTLVIFISSAGAEGLDLKGTRSVVILEPHWNNEKIKQIVGRTVRYKSHSELPIRDTLTKTSS